MDDKTFASFRQRVSSGKGSALTPEQYAEIRAIIDPCVDNPMPPVLQVGKITLARTEIKDPAGGTTVYLNIDHGELQQGIYLQEADFVAHMEKFQPTHPTEANILVVGDVTIQEFEEGTFSLTTLADPTHSFGMQLYAADFSARLREMISAHFKDLGQGDVLDLSSNDVQILDLGNDLDDELETPATFIPAQVVEAQIHGEPIATGPRPTQPLFSKRKAFTDELASLINRHSLESYSNTPDFILAALLMDTLTNFGKTMQERDRWKSPEETEENFGLYIDGWLLNGTDTIGEVQVIPPADVEGVHPFVVKSSVITAFLERRHSGNL